MFLKIFGYGLLGLFVYLNGVRPLWRYMFPIEPLTDEQIDLAFDEVRDELMVIGIHKAPKTIFSLCDWLLKQDYLLMQKWNRRIEKQLGWEESNRRLVEAMVDTGFYESDDGVYVQHINMV